MFRVRARRLLLCGLALGAAASCKRREPSVRESERAANSTRAPRVPVAPPEAGASATPIESAAVPAEKPRVYVKNRFVFVRPRADVNADWIGFLWFGASVELRSTEPVRGPGCASYYAIEPSGYVCVDEKQATLNADDAVYKAVSRFAPRLDQPSPHRYAQSNGVQLHPALPGTDNQFGNLPPLFHEPRRRFLPFSTVAYADERTVAGETWLLSADFLWFKADEVTRYPEVSFHGVELGREYRLPLAFFRQKGARKYRRNDAGKLARTEDEFALQSVVQLADEVEVQRGVSYRKVAATEDWVREVDAVIPSPRGTTPWGAHVGVEDRTGRAPKNQKKSWLEVSVLGGWLLAFEGTRAVYATLISPGRGGIPKDGEDTLEIAATPLGTFPISGKLATVTMDSPGESLHSDVPWTQNFEKPYAIHAAYWHNNWGNPQSGGCINVSPIDGKWLFDFSEPALPSGWHAVRWRPGLADRTLLVVHE
ncbi:MAG TPA: L,D-transpeptidase [Polyangiaceae bacterium]|nr:L,D-transpeptidase [Polyangiaceae bacterium]